jgi:hypothetical protein
MGLLAAAAAITAIGTLVLLAIYRRAAVAAWREPVLQQPVVIFESDDWSPGPATDASRLRQIGEALKASSDSTGRHPVATLGVVLRIPDRARIVADGYAKYTALSFDGEPFSAVRAAICAGQAEGVFDAQLHGMEHYRRETLLAAARTDKRVRQWFEQEGPARTEDLPAELQSRWIDGGSLPSGRLDAEEVASEAGAEAAAFRALFSRDPEVAVPPTFVWNDAVETAWATAGVRVIVTPGRRFEYRDRAGRPGGPARPIRNGDRSPYGPLYVVRDEYFEPLKGHRAEDLWLAVERKARRGRPALMEMHRFNFTGTPDSAERSLAELARGLAGLGSRFPTVRYMTTRELAAAIERTDPALVQTDWIGRLRAWTWRMADERLFLKLSWLSGLLLPLGLALALSVRPGRAKAD